MPGDLYETFYPGAKEMRHMFEYFEQYTYFGPDAKAKIERSDKLAGAGTPFDKWAKHNLKY